MPSKVHLAHVTMFGDIFGTGGALWGNQEVPPRLHGFVRFLPSGPAQASGTALTKKAAQLLFKMFLSQGSHAA
eukprot:s198_g25.t1